MYVRSKRKPDPIWKMEENIMDDFKVFYDEEEDILTLQKRGKGRRCGNISRREYGA
jgi:hypothetical protein